MTKRIDYAGVVLSMDPEREERQQVRTQLQWDYGQVPALHRKAVEDAAVEIAVNGRKMTASVMGVGDALIRAKGLLAHGQFEEWCRVEFGMSERTAQNMMNVARTFAGKSAKISLLSDSTLYLLAAPSTPEPVREAVIQQAESTGRSPSVAEVRKSIELTRASAGEGEKGLPPELEREFLRRYFDLDGLIPVSDPRRSMELRIERRNHVADAPWRWETDGRAVLVWHASNGEYWQRHSDARYTHMKAMQLAMQLLAEMKQAPVAGKTLMQVLATDEERQIEAGIAAMDEAERQALAASDLQVMQPAPAAHGINGAFVRTHASATGDPRLGKLRRLVSLYEMVANSFDEFGGLTGRDTETLAAGREMRKLIGWLQREISLLEGREVEPLELESEGWG